MVQFCLFSFVGSWMASTLVEGTYDIWVPYIFRISWATELSHLFESKYPQVLAFNIV